MRIRTNVSPLHVHQCHILLEAASKPLEICLVVSMWTVLAVGLNGSAYAQQEARLLFVQAGSGDLVIAIQPDFHARWGFFYPMTYQLSVPSGSSGLKVEEKYSSGGTWSRLPEKVSSDHFDGVEAARFDYDVNQAYVSAAFSPTSDSLFLRITDQTDNAIATAYHGIASTTITAGLL